MNQKNNFFALESFIEKIIEAKEKSHLIVFFCNCIIEYKGRAEAFLPKGDRLVIIKQDSSLLIHQPINGSPINYLKAPASISFKKKENSFLLKAESGSDNLILKIFKIYNIMEQKLIDGQKQVLVGNEADMSDMIKENPSLISDEFKPLSREEHTKVGFIDVFGYEKDKLVVVECKRYTASLACVTQLKRYVDKLKKIKHTDKVTGVMASPNITTNAMNLLKEWGFRWVRVYPPKRLMVAKDQKNLSEFNFC